jgi:hypothetical protein
MVETTVRTWLHIRRQWRAKGGKQTDQAERSDGVSFDNATAVDQERGDGTECVSVCDPAEEIHHQSYETDRKGSKQWIKKTGKSECSDPGNSSYAIPKADTDK